MFISFHAHIDTPSKFEMLNLEAFHQQSIMIPSNEIESVIKSLIYFLKLHNTV